MKLSMWMIANRLSALDPEVHVRDSAPIILRSARRAYATNCVHMFQVGKDEICNEEGDYVRLSGLEIIRCVFDFYEDWNTDIMEVVSGWIISRPLMKAGIFFIIRCCFWTQTARLWL